MIHKDSLYRPMQPCRWPLAFWRAFISKLNYLSYSLSFCHYHLFSSVSLHQSLCYAIYHVFFSLEIVWVSSPMSSGQQKHISVVFIYFGGNLLHGLFHNPTVFNKILALYNIFHAMESYFFLISLKLVTVVTWHHFATSPPQFYKPNSFLLNWISLINPPCGIWSESLFM